MTQLVRRVKENDVEIWDAIITEEEYVHEKDFDCFTSIIIWEDKGIINNLIVTNIPHEDISSIEDLSEDIESLNGNLYNETEVNYLFEHINIDFNNFDENDDEFGEGLSIRWKKEIYANSFLIDYIRNILNDKYNFNLANYY